MFGWNKRNNGSIYGDRQPLVDIESRTIAGIPRELLSARYRPLIVELWWFGTNAKLCMPAQVHVLLNGASGIAVVCVHSHTIIRWVVYDTIINVEKSKTTTAELLWNLARTWFPTGGIISKEWTPQHVWMVKRRLHSGKMTYSSKERLT